MTSTVHPDTHHDLASLQSRIAGNEDTLFSILLANSQPRIGTYIALAKAIQDAGHLAVVVHPHDLLPSDEELVGFESVEFASIPLSAVKALHGVNLLFSSEVLSDVAPPDAVTVGILHSLPDAGLSNDEFASSFSANLRQQPTVIRTFDYLVASVRQTAAEWASANYAFIQGVYPPTFLKGRRKFIDIVPGGYPKLDYSRRILASPAPPHCIVYSPTSNGSALSRVGRDGEAILSALLQGLPEFTVVFRPYPHRPDMQEGRSLARRFATNPRFVFDDTTTGVRYQRECAVAVTDSSSSAITFSLATHRPLVFVELKDSAPPTAPARNPFGFTAESVPAMIAAVKSGIDHAPLWKRTIMAEAEKYIYNPGSAAEYLAAHLPRFADRQSHRDWLSVERRPWLGTGEEGEVDRHLHRLRTWSDRPSANASRMYNEIADYLAAAE